MRAYNFSVEAIHVFAVVVAVVLGGRMIEQSLHRDGPAVFQTRRRRSKASGLGVTVFILV